MVLAVEPSGVNPAAVPAASTTPHLRLLELEPRFLRRTEDPRIYDFVDDINVAEGVQFLCPVCFKKNGGAVGTHSILCWTPAIPLTIGPGPGRWNLRGTGYADLSLVAGSSSVQLEGGCNAHFHITNGEIL